jgi:hypothetical protein
MAITWEAVPALETVSHIDLEQAANQNLYAVVSGCTVTESASDMVVTVAAGVALVNGVQVTVAGDTITLVADATNKRWSYATIDSSGDVILVSGTPAASALVEPTKPDPAGKTILKMYKIEAAQTIAADIAVAPEKRIIVPAAPDIPTIVLNYKSSTQVFTTDTTFADVTGAKAATFAFAIAPNEVWDVDYWIPLAFGGTGGVKFQLTGPGTPTDVNITGVRSVSQRETGPGASSVFMLPFAAITAFSTDVAAGDSAASSSQTVDKYPNDIPALAHIKARIINGANAGAVTLQAAQNSSNSTTTLGIGSTMRAEKVG